MRMTIRMIAVLGVAATLAARAQTHVLDQTIATELLRGATGEMAVGALQSSPDFARMYTTSVLEQELAQEAAMRGLDSLAATQEGGEIVRLTAKKLGCIVAATGETDFVSDGQEVCQIENGDALLSRITGAGCMTTSLVATCCGAMGGSLAAVAAGVLFMGIAGEKARIALKEGEGPGSFRVRLLDAVGNLTGRDVLARGRCSFE